MNTRRLISAALVAAAFAAVYVPPKKSLAQSEFGNRFLPTIQMMVDGDTNGARQRTLQFGIMDPIGVFPNEQIGINLIVPSNRSNYPVGLAPLDGGEIFGAENLYVASNATVHFSFKSGDTPGFYRVLVIIASEQYQLLFHVPRSVPDGGCTPP